MMKSLPRREPVSPMMGDQSPFGWWQQNCAHYLHKPVDMTGIRVTLQYCIFSTKQALKYHQICHLVFQVTNFLHSFINRSSFCCNHSFSLLCIWVEKSCIYFAVQRRLNLWIQKLTTNTYNQIVKLSMLPLFIFQGHITSQNITILCSPLHVWVSGTMIEDKTLNLELKAIHN